MKRESVNQRMRTSKTMFSPCVFKELKVLQSSSSCDIVLFHQASGNALLKRERENAGERQHSASFSKNHFGVNGLTSVWLDLGKREAEMVLLRVLTHSNGWKSLSPKRNE